MPAKEDYWARAGDVGRFALLGAAIAAPLRRRDVDRSLDALAAIIVCSAVSKAVKAFWHETRPSGEDDNSFPSQHTAECFAAALSLKRTLPGTPSVTATAVAVTRVLARKHHVLDVVAGAAIGIAAASFKRCDRAGGS